MTPAPVPSPLTAVQLVDEYFIENRNRIIEVAAFLDRLDRVDPDIANQDFRVKALHQALELALAGSATGRVREIQLLMSDQDDRPLAALDRKGAVGAPDPSNRSPRV
jgi:hypothetical protein